jgi:hypothetical protein
MSVERLIAKLAMVKEVKPRGKNQQSWIACCPAHDDSSPSLQIDVGESGNTLIHCWAGCSVEEVCDSIGISMASLFPENGYRQQSFRKRPHKDKDYHEFVLHISKQDRLNGKKQSQADKDQELESYNFLRGSH